MTAARKRAWVAATLDTKAAEAEYVCGLLEAAGLNITLADLSTSSNSLKPSTSSTSSTSFTSFTSSTSSTSDRVLISPADVAAHDPHAQTAISSAGRGSAIAAMTQAFEHFIRKQDNVGGILGLGGSGGTAIIAPAMRALPIGVPKVLVSTMASGNVAGYVGACDVTMVYSVTDMAGMNRISRLVLSNAAHALAGMMLRPVAPQANERPAVGLTMFGVTTPCVQQISQRLSSLFDCLVFHATGTGGQSMEKLLEDGHIAGLLDITTTEVCDHLFGGVLACTEDRFGAVARTRAPYVGSCGALDMVNFGPPESVPERYRARNFYRHNPQITLMRTTAEENVRQARWIAARLNRCEGKVRFLLPMGGVSALDAPGQAFFDPTADAALFDTLLAEFQPTDRRKLVQVPHHINDPQFARIAAEQFLEIVG